MSTDRIPGAYPLSIQRTGVGVRIDAYRLVWELLAELAGQYAEDPEGVGEQLEAIAASSGPERDALLETLTDDIGGSDCTFGASAARQMAERLMLLAGPSIPSQQDRRAA